MNIRKMKIFYATATSLNMSKVAKEMYISQPSVSQAIHEFEEEIGAKLFDRIGKRLYLTNEGEVALSYVRRMLNLYEEAFQKIGEIANEEKGKIIIGASTTIGTYILPSVIKKYMNEHAGVEISLIIENTANIERLILENKVDFALVEGTVYSDEIMREKIWNDELVFIVPDNHPLKDKGYIEGDTLINEKLIMREQGSGTRGIIEDFFKDKEIKYKVYLELGHTEAIKRSVEANLGVGCISKKCLSSNESYLRVKEGKIERDLHLIYHNDKFLNNNMKKFILCLKDETLDS